MEELLGSISINALALQAETVISSICDTYTVIFNIHLSHSVYYKNITFLNGYRESSTTNVWDDGTIGHVDVIYSYSTY